jgi:hypothetical protein
MDSVSMVFAWIGVLCSLRLVWPVGVSVLALVVRRVRMVWFGCAVFRMVFFGFLSGVASGLWLRVSCSLWLDEWLAMGFL